MQSETPLVIIQIPCFNEAATLPVVLADLPREIAGVRRVEWLVIDDGSEDGTAEVARAHGVDHVVRLPSNRGLAHAWRSGVDAALARGADIVVNTDGDSQYAGSAIPALVAAVQGGSDIAVGARPIREIAHFSPLKKTLQRLGSWAMRALSGTPVADAPSGFRAISREAALRLCVMTGYTYTLETLIHAGAAGLRVTNVPVPVNPDLRPSRLVKSIASYVRRSLTTMVRVWCWYHAGRLFLVGAAVALAATAALAVCALLGGPAPGLGVASVSAVVLGTAAVISDGLALQRRLLLEVRALSRAAAFDRPGIAREAADERG